MKAIFRRLKRLEDRRQPSEETESSQRLRERIEAGRRRVENARQRLGLPPAEEWPLEYPSEPLTISQLLHRGRERAARIA